MINILTSCDDRGVGSENSDISNLTVLDTGSNSIFDSTQCIVTNCYTPCLHGIVCSDDTIRYNASKLMLRVDSALEEDQPKALECSCGYNYYELGNDSIEVILFAYGSGGGNVWYRMYKRKEKAKFELIRSFNPETPGTIELLDGRHQGVSDFIFDERRGSKYTLTFNGQYFDTIKIEPRNQ